MPRTTIDIDGSVLAQIRRLADERGTSMTRVVSELLATALSAARRTAPAPRAFAWTAKPMGARVDLEDADAVYAALER